MKIRYIVLSLVMIVLLVIIGSFLYERAHVSLYDEKNEISILNNIEGESSMNYTQILMDEAKQIFESDTAGSYIILDVRRADEYAAGHIPGAINVANESIGIEAPIELPDKNQIIYVYCRSGNRSRQAAEKLAKIGYSNIIEFGGIIDWTGQIEKTEGEKETVANS